MNFDKNNKWNEIVKYLIKNNFTIATMESCTGGGIANEITSISGASSVLKESYVTYCNEAKIKQGVCAEVIEKYSVYSAEVAKSMAIAVKKQANSNLGIGVTGQLGRIDPNNPVDKLNLVWYAIVDYDNKVFEKKLEVPDSERRFQKEFVIEDIANSLLKILNHKL